MISIVSNQAIRYTALLCSHFVHKFVPLSFTQVPYNLLWRSIEYDIVPACEKYNIGILAYSPLQQGMLSGKYLTLDDVPEGRRRTRLFNAKR